MPSSKVLSLALSNNSSKAEGPWPKLGILGGGQLGRMLLEAASPWGLTARVLDPDKHCCCSALGADFTIGDFTDADVVENFAKECDILTIEIENVSVEGLRRAEKSGVQVFPQPSVVEIVQDKGLQKQFFVSHGLPTAPFVLLANGSMAAEYTEFLPAFLKTRRAGYDGRGVMAVDAHTPDAELFPVPCVLEQAAPMAKEISVLVARNQKGEISAWPAVEMVMDPVHNLLKEMRAPAALPDSKAAEATQLAMRTAESLGIVGVLAVEMFLLRDGTLWINEVAPRPHNSGHHTIECCITSQYQQHLRCVLGLPLGSAAQLSKAIMINLLGKKGQNGKADYSGIAETLSQPGAYLHLYGKPDVKPFRKMGHVTLIGGEWAELEMRAAAVASSLSAISKK